MNSWNGSDHQIPTITVGHLLEGITSNGNFSQIDASTSRNAH